MNRLDFTLNNVKKSGGKAFVSFIMGCDGGVEKTLQTMWMLCEQGVDIIEIGLPFSDPMADGVIIQAAGQRALEAGGNIHKVLEIVQEFRGKNKETPIVLMGYYNPILRFGLVDFSNSAAQAGVDGLIIVDLPAEEEDEVIGTFEKAGLFLVRLIAPTTKGERLKASLKHAKGFTYLISVAGTTGTKEADMEGAKAVIAEIRQHSNLPVMLGFGIKTPEQAKAAAQVADGVVVGSAIVDKSANAPSDLADFLKNIRVAIG